MKRQGKLLVDIVMYVLFLYLMSYQAGRGLLLHGVLGCVLFGLFLFHHLRIRADGAPCGPPYSRSFEQAAPEGPRNILRLCVYPAVSSGYGGGNRMLLLERVMAG